MSSLGGGVDLGLHGKYGHKLISVQTADMYLGNYGTTYATYYTVNQSYAIAGQNISVSYTHLTLPTKRIV